MPQFNVDINGKKVTIGGVSDTDIRALKSLPQNKLRNAVLRKLPRKKFDKVLDNIPEDERQKVWESLTPSARRKSATASTLKGSLMQNLPPLINKRPTTLPETMAISLAEDDWPSRVKAYQEKFGKENVYVRPEGLAIHTDKGDMLIDQPGLGKGNIRQKALEGVHDIVEVYPEVTRELGQAIGASLGGITALGAGQIPPLTATPEEAVTVPTGIAVGGGLGRGAGQFTNEMIAKALGVKDIKPAKVASNVSTSAQYGAAGEILAPATIKGAQKMMKTIVQKARAGGRAGLKGIAHIFAGIDTDALEYAMKNNFDNITPKNLSKRAVERTAKKVAIGTKKLKQISGKAFNDFKQLHGDETVDLGDDISNAIINRLKLNNRLVFKQTKKGIEIVPAKTATGGKIASTKGLLKMAKKLKGRKKVGEVMGTLEHEIPSLRTIHGTDDTMYVNLKEVLTEKVKQQFPEFAEAKGLWRIYRGLDDFVKGTHGLNLTKDYKVTDSDKLIQNFKGLFSKESLDTFSTLSTANNTLPPNYRFLKELYDVASAQQFASNVPLFWRAGLAQGLITPVTGYMAGGVPGGMLGMAATMPRIWGKALKGSAKAYKPLTEGISTITERFFAPAAERLAPFAPKIAAGIGEQVQGQGRSNALRDEVLGELRKSPVLR